MIDEQQRISRPGAELQPQEPRQSAMGFEWPNEGGTRT